MNSLFQNHPKRSRRRALGTLFLALPLSGLALRLTPAQSQPAPSLPVPAKKSPLSLEQKATIGKLLAISRQEKVCKTVIDFKVENASLQDVLNRVKTMLPEQTVAIEVRGARPVRVSFDLKEARVGNVLNHVAALAGCQLWVLSQGLLIAPASQLTEAELRDVKQAQGGRWAGNAEVSDTGWSGHHLDRGLFTRAIAQEATGSNAVPLPPGVVKTTFSNFSPESQTMLREIASWMDESDKRSKVKIGPIRLSAESPVSVDTSKPNSIIISFDRGTSDPNALASAYGQVTFK